LNAWNHGMCCQPIPCLSYGSIEWCFDVLTGCDSDSPDVSSHGKNNEAKRWARDDWRHNY
jgi:hypothetical protein